MTEQLWLSASIDIGRNQDSQNNYGPLYNEQDTMKNKKLPARTRFCRALHPGDWDTLAASQEGVPGRSVQGARNTRPLNELLAVAGVRMTTHDTAQGLQTLTARFEADKGDAQKLLLGPLTNRGTIDPGDVKAGYEQANKRRKALYYQMRQNYLGSQKLGLTETQAINAMMIGYGSEARKTGIGQGGSPVDCRWSVFPLHAQQASPGGSSREAPRPIRCFPESL